MLGFGVGLIAHQLTGFYAARRVKVALLVSDNGYSVLRLT